MPTAYVLETQTVEPDLRQKITSGETNYNFESAVKTFT